MILKCQSKASAFSLWKLQLWPRKFNTLSMGKVKTSSIIYVCFAKTLTFVQFCYERFTMRFPHDIFSSLNWKWVYNTNKWLLSPAIRIKCCAVFPTPSTVVEQSRGKNPTGNGRNRLQLNKKLIFGILIQYILIFVMFLLLRRKFRLCHSLNKIAYGKVIR